MRALGQHPAGLPAIGFQHRIVFRQAGDQVAGEAAAVAGGRVGAGD
ncbi:MAG: hypothetical protein KGL52_03890 [Rhodospirillales bacterium]|nr:hypothetical protein [Rhodospirillales bacterium]